MIDFLFISSTVSWPKEGPGFDPQRDPCARTVPGKAVDQDSLLNTRVNCTTHVYGL